MAIDPTLLLEGIVPGACGLHEGWHESLHAHNAHSAVPLAGSWHTSWQFFAAAVQTHTARHDRPASQDTHAPLQIQSMGLFTAAGEGPSNKPASVEAALPPTLQLCPRPLWPPPLAGLPQPPLP